MRVYGKLFWVYSVAYLVMLVFMLTLLFVYPKPELHLLLNSCHTSFLDVFFKYYTILAEWPLYVLALLPLFWKKGRLTLFFAVSELASGAFLQILKRIVKMPRPASVFEDQLDVLPLVDGVSLHHSNSFPSGHASTFFVFFTCCALLLACHYWKETGRYSRTTWIQRSLVMLSLLAAAALGAYSRVYLSQHFLSDICMGSFIGFVFPCLVYYLYFNRRRPSRIARADGEGCRRPSSSGGCR